MNIQPTSLPGCYEIQPNIFEDDRGKFVKIFHQEVFAEYKLETHFAEEYYSVSHQRVLRGLHFQLPPYEHTKLVYCVVGQVMDAVVDLRVGSPTYGKYATFELSAQKANLIYIPPGFAHGFYVLSDRAVLIYKVTTVYSREHDAGILWNSVGIPWSDKQPIISARDSSFVTFADFLTPFRYSEEATDGC
ncbi:dTDP-4-dehydrorhamnose 3,5-epimerase [Phormidium sp. LEGE 05292]|uniref:dTDP-4-dehydrorhamnose 3,5-epimerase n=1 Tax=[Phormidium] sp. LEGE 05292 TaxID=767427 RepID=UPI00187E7C40|nr:dTDP-4-dehydrorhamnose 3,5-epimerase [Phormidium sp. LEGE 05292]MBE9224570.1 dTDP-4-dehydrorhamnose 3,5-epimerase [Phormidium sp. LEGE 05292]